MENSTHHFDVADGVLVVDELPHLGGARVVHPHGGVHELDPRGVAGGEDGVEVGGAERGRLLEEQVLAPRGGGGGPAHVKAGGEREVDDVDIRVVEERLVGPVEAGGGDVEAVVGGEEAGLLLGAAPHGGDGGAGGQQHGARELARDGGAAQDAEAHGARRLVRRRRGRHGWRRAGGALSSSTRGSLVCGGTGLFDSRCVLIMALSMSASLLLLQLESS